MTYRADRRDATSINFYKQDDGTLWLTHLPLVTEISPGAVVGLADHLDLDAAAVLTLTASNLVARYRLTNRDDTVIGEFIDCHVPSPPDGIGDLRAMLAESRFETAGKCPDIMDCANGMPL